MKHCHFHSKEEFECSVNDHQNLIDQVYLSHPFLLLKHQKNHSEQ